MLLLEHTTGLAHMYPTYFTAFVTPIHGASFGLHSPAWPRQAKSVNHQGSQIVQITLNSAFCQFKMFPCQINILDG